MVLERIYLRLARIFLGIAVHLVEWSRTIVNSYYDTAFNSTNLTFRKSCNDLSILDHEFWKLNRALEM